MKKSLIFSLLAASLLPILAGAQSEEVESQDPVDEIISFGSIQTDPAMSAFRAGDYETAEVEFKKNAFCALRAQRAFESGVEASRDSTLRADVGVDLDTPSGAAGGPGGAAIGPTRTAPTPTARLNSADLNKKENKLKRTCEDRGFQIYMMGMSQLKLGKREEAKEAFYRAVNMRKTLYDAHFRLGLLEYQDGNIKGAKKQAEKIKKLEKRCKNRCDAKDEIKAQVEFMEKLFG